jgi:hypothetical protein
VHTILPETLHHSATETGFKIERSPVDVLHFAQIATVGANVTTFTDSGLAESKKYYSNEVNGFTALAKPTSATATAKSSSRIDLTCNDNSVSETGYKIERKKTVDGAYTQITQVGANVQSYSDTTGLEAYTTYYYRVRATNGTLNSDYSNEPHAKTLR